MWYFTWILGLGHQLAFGIINVMWLEASYFPASSMKAYEALARRATDRLCSVSS
jgi:cyd operon protein YbgT